MKKIENKIDFNEVFEAVKKWATCTDGYDGAVGGIFETIPWGCDLEKVFCWDSVQDGLGGIIGCCPHLDATKVLIEGNAQQFYNYTVRVTKGICDWYQRMIDRANKILATNYRANLHFVGKPRDCWYSQDENDYYCFFDDDEGVWYVTHIGDNNGRKWEGIWKFKSHEELLTFIGKFFVQQWGK